MPPHWVQRFLEKADTWVIAYAVTLGGRICTFEKPEPLSRKPKIPDVALEFGAECIQIWDMLSDLNAEL